MHWGWPFEGWAKICSCGVSSNERWLCKLTKRYSKLYHFAWTIWTLCVIVGNQKESHIMPLIALTGDRKASLQRRGVASIYLGGEDHDTDMKTFRDDRMQYVFANPETRETMLPQLILIVEFSFQIIMWHFCWRGPLYVVSIIVDSTCKSLCIWTTRKWQGTFAIVRSRHEWETRIVVSCQHTHMLNLSLVFTRQ